MYMSQSDGRWHRCVAARRLDQLGVRMPPGNWHLPRRQIAPTLVSRGTTWVLLGSREAIERRGAARLVPPELVSEALPQLRRAIGFDAGRSRP